MKLKKHTFSKFLFLIASLSVIYTISLFDNLESVLRLLVSILIILINILFFINYMYFNKRENKSKRRLKDIILIFISLLMILSSTYVIKMFYKLKNINKGGNSSYTLVGLEKKDSITNSTITYLVEDKGAYETLINEKLNTNNKLLSKHDYNLIINDVIHKKTTYAILPSNYEKLFSKNKNINKLVKIKEFNIKHHETTNDTGGLDNPFSFLLLGIDEKGGNKDVIILGTFNPRKLRVNLISIPRDTLLNNSTCIEKDRKINSASTSCLIRTLNNLFNTNIKYYAEFNFEAVVNLVDSLGGISYNVKSPICEQNSKRSMHRNDLVLVEKGEQILNGEKALALMRHRKSMKESPELYYACPRGKGYNEGPASDHIRSERQKEIINAIINKSKDIKSLSKLDKIIDIATKDTETNVTPSTLFSAFNLLKNAYVEKRDKTDDLVSIRKLELIGTDQKIRVHWYHDPIWFLVPNDKSIRDLKNLINDEINDKKASHPNYNFSYDPTENYSRNEELSREHYASSRLNLMPDFTRMTKNAAINFITNNKLNYELKYEDSGVSNDVIIKQSIPSGSKINPGDKIILTLTKKIENKPINCEKSTEDKCKMPSLIGKTVSDINDWSRKYYYNLTIIYYDSTSEDIHHPNKKRKILSQSIETGKKASNFNTNILKLKLEDEVQNTVPAVDNKEEKPKNN